MNGRATPAFGIPTAVQLLREELREDLKAHEERDERRFTELRGDLTEFRDDVKSLLVSQSAQTAILTELKDTRAFKRSLWLKAFGLVTGGGLIVELVHRWL